MKEKFIEVLREYGYPMSPWVDKSLYRMVVGDTTLDFILNENEARVAIGGVGAAQYLIAKNQDELRQNIAVWVRHR